MRKKNQRRLIQQHILAIDAHNVCYQIAAIRQHMQHDVECARRAFEDLLDTHGRCHIFYDGGPGGEERRQQRGAISVHYSGTRSADDCIIEWLSYQHCPGITLISDDRHLQLRAKNLGAHIGTVNEFLNNLDQPTSREPRIDEVAPSDTEIDFWKAQFGVED